MSSRWKLYYGVAAVVAASIVIAAASLGAPMVNSNQFAKAWQFPIMLTDPPIVPEGTTLLDLTYSNILLHINHSDKTATWLPVEAKGTVNLLSLVNVSQTLAAVTLPADSQVNKIQFTIADVTATVNGTDYDVTPLSDTIVLTIQNKANNAQSGVLVDFNPTLIETQSIDADENTVNSYVLAPSATAIIISGLSGEQTKVGAVVDLRLQDMEELKEAQEAHDVAVTAASLSVKCDETVLSVTLKNQGTSIFSLFGLTLQGEFDSTKIKNAIIQQSLVNDGNNSDKSYSMNNTRTVPFKIDGVSLNPLFGTNKDQESADSGDENAYANSFLTLQAGEEVTLTFTGVIQLQTNEKSPLTVLVPLECNAYMIRLMGDGSQTFEIQAEKFSLIAIQSLVRT